ncbi:MAG TPA: hypothetical protein DD628_05090 [Clostridiales bacterium]|nr:hypothetical protein [Candidatus Apopatosoma intestinale]
MVLFVIEKYDKRKVTSCLFIKRLLIRHASRDTFCPCLGDADRVRLRESVNSPQEKAFYPLFLLHMRAQKKKLSKRKRRKKISRSAERDKSYACPRLGDADTHASHMCQSPDCASLSKGLT